jgi:hypothetical protein
MADQEDTTENTRLTQTSPVQAAAQLDKPEVDEQHTPLKADTSPVAVAAEKPQPSIVARSKYKLVFLGDEAVGKTVRITLGLL